MAIRFLCTPRYMGFAEVDQQYIATLTDPDQIDDYRSGWTTNGLGEAVPIPFDTEEIEEISDAQAEAELADAHERWKAGA